MVVKKVCRKYVCNGVPLNTVDYQQAEMRNCCLSVQIVVYVLKHKSSCLVTSFQLPICLACSSNKVVYFSTFVTSLCSQMYSHCAIFSLDIVLSSVRTHFVSLF